MSDPETSPPELRAGWELLQQGRFHAAHEPFEALWRATRGPERALYQALVHLCAALYHGERGNLRGQAAQAARGLARLAGLPGRCAGVDVACVRGLLEGAARGEVEVIESPW